MKCSFCGYNIGAGTGKILAKKTGEVYYLCSNKCEKNMFKLHRNPRNVHWTTEFKRLKDTVLAANKAKGKTSMEKESKAKNPKAN